MLEDKNLGKFEEENDKEPQIGSVQEEKEEKDKKIF